MTKGIFQEQNQTFLLFELYFYKQNKQKNNTKIGSVLFILVKGRVSSGNEMGTAARVENFDSLNCQKTDTSIIFCSK